MIIIHDDTGRIQSTATVVDSEEYIQKVVIPNGLQYVEVDGNPNTFYVDVALKGKPMKRRPPLEGLALSLPTVAPGQETVITGIPNGSEVRIFGPLHRAFTHSGGGLTLSFAIPGIYTVEVEKFPARRTPLQIEVTG